MIGLTTINGIFILNMSVVMVVVKTISKLSDAIFLRKSCTTNSILGNKDSNSFCKMIDVPMPLGHKINPRFLFTCSSCSSKADAAKCTVKKAISSVGSSLSNKGCKGLIASLTKAYISGYSFFIL